MCFNQACHFILIAHFVCLLSYLYKAMSVMFHFAEEKKNFENLTAVLVWLSLKSCHSLSC